MEVLPHGHDTRPTAPAVPNSLPKVPKPEDKPLVETKSNNGNEIISLAFDEVNDNADELIELRGEGRYFGVTDPSGTTINQGQSLGPLCGNCHRRGHIRAKCKTVVCHKCGVVGDHYETQCPTTMVCSRCGLKGHMAMECTNKMKKRQYCRQCDSMSHLDETCPSIWRSYLTLPGKDDSTVLPVIYCYNCGDDTHFGDECPKMRSSRVPNPSGSAFSGSNLPRHLRDMYFRRLSQQRSAPSAPRGGRDYYDHGYAQRAPAGPGAKRANYSSGSSGSSSGSLFSKKSDRDYSRSKSQSIRSGKVEKPKKLRLGLIEKKKKKKALNY